MWFTNIEKFCSVLTLILDYKWCRTSLLFYKSYSKVNLLLRKYWFSKLPKGVVTTMVEFMNWWTIKYLHISDYIWLSLRQRCFLYTVCRWGGSAPILSYVNDFIAMIIFRLSSEFTHLKINVLQGGHHQELTEQLFKTEGYFLS